MKVCIFHTAFLGDLANIGLMIQALYDANHEIILATNEGGYKLFKSDFRISKHLIIKKNSGLKKFPALFSIVKTLRHAQIEVLICPHRSFTTGLIALLSQIPKKVSFLNCALPLAFTELRPFYKHLHESQRCLQLLPEWIISQNLRKEFEKIRRPILVSNSTIPTFFSKHLELLNPSSRYFMINPGSVWATKVYPPSFLAQVVLSLLQKSKGLYCVVNGGPDDKRFIEEFFSALGTGQERVINASTSLPLDEMIAVTARASFIISNDSLPLHIGSGVNVPVIGIFGPTSAENGFGPASDRHVVVTFRDELGQKLNCQPCSLHGHQKCPRVHHRCMRDLAPHTVVAAVTHLLPEFF